ncbi:hypothetical protein NC652_025027 [Populus alba x Populus x berolinensis]|nr:hypothetical protein NC652_025027 [Populus alba x Populus x berolinensis]
MSIVPVEHEANHGQHGPVFEYFTRQDLYIFSHNILKHQSPRARLPFCTGRN